MQEIEAVAPFLSFKQNHGIEQSPLYPEDQAKSEYLHETTGVTLSSGLFRAVSLLGIHEEGPDDQSLANCPPPSIIRARLSILSLDIGELPRSMI